MKTGIEVVSWGFIQVVDFELWGFFVKFVWKHYCILLTYVMQKYSVCAKIQRCSINRADFFQTSFNPFRHKHHFS